jgi:hypothetical protein
VGVATCFKQVAAVDAGVFVLLFPLLATGERRARRLVHFAGWAALGGIALWLPILAWFHAQGGLAALLDAVILHNLSYVRGLAGEDRIRHLLYGLSALWATGWGSGVLPVVGIAFLMREPERWRVVYLGGWLLSGALAVSASGHYFVHYFQQVLPALAIAAAAGVQGLYRAAALRRVPGWLRGAALVALALAQPVLDSAALWRLDPAQAMKRIYPTNMFEVIPAVADEVAALTTPDDKVFVFGAEPQLFFYAQRRSASRYIFLFPLFGRYADALERQQSVIDEIRRDRPAVILSAPLAQFNGPGLEQELTFWLSDYVDANYRLHALVVGDHGGTGRILRTTDAGYDDSLVGEAWAQIFVRR